MHTCAGNYNLTYVQIPAWQLASCEVRGAHVLIGTTVRTVDKPGEIRILHAVVGFAGEFAWDPHPSRAGLVEVTGLGFLLSPSGEWGWNKTMAERELSAWREGKRGAVSALCCCPLCFNEGEYL